MLFSDSQFRPVFDGDVVVPSNWYVNSTPGGCFYHITVEMKEAAKRMSDPRCVVFCVGTNDVSRHMMADRVKKDYQNLLLAGRSCFPSAKVCN